MSEHKVRKMRSLRNDGTRTHRARTKSITRRYQRNLKAGT